jgi:hypothetical protein
MSLLSASAAAIGYYMQVETDAYKAGMMNDILAVGGA